MKNDKKMKKSYQKRIDERLKIIEEQISLDCLTNPLLKQSSDIPNYFKDWIEGSRLVAVIPALNYSNPESQRYYSVGKLNECIEQDEIRVSPVHMYINSNEENLENNRRFFIFDTEESKLYTYKKKEYSHTLERIKSPQFDEIYKNIQDHPVILFFYGCDDGHVGKRFKTESEAFEYLQIIDVFEDIFDKDLEYHN